MTEPSKANEKTHAARVSVFSNSLLVLLKLAVGVSIGSVAVLSEAVHSATDLIAALLAFFAVRASDAPPDTRHPYGHGKVEAVAAVLEAVLILGAGGYIIQHSVRALFASTPAQETGWGLVVMGFSALVNTFVARHLHRTARKTESVALEADAHHLWIDVYTSLGVMTGLALVAVTGRAFFDPLVALVVAVFILKTGWDVMRAAFAPLVDERLPDDEISRVEAIIREHPEVLSWHKLRTRKAGSQRHIDVHIQVEDEMSLRDAHRVTEELEDQMRAAWPGAQVVIHTEPFEEEKRHHEEVPH